MYMYIYYYSYNFYACFILFQALGVFFIKASGYRMVQDNARHGAVSYWYSLEHESKKSVFNLLFLNDRPADTEGGKTLF